MSEHVEQAYRHCLALAHSHYENFPVASFLLPAKLRRPIAVIYAFARTADDLADEGDLTTTERLDALEAYHHQLDHIEQAQPSDAPIFIALDDVIQRYQLPMQLFHDLLSAFEQDVVKRRYQSFEELLDYCRRSANPVGRLLLHLSDNDSDANLRDSDKICSALQLINFLQDIQQDLSENDRIYIPVDEMEQFGVSEQDLRQQRDDEAVQSLITLQRERAKGMMLDGASLGGRLKGRFGWEIRAIVAGGLAIIDRLERQKSPYARPRLGRGELTVLLAKSLFR